MRSKERLTSAAKARGRCCRHTSARTDEEALAEPCLKSRYLPADGAMGQPEFGSRFSIAACPGGNLEDAQGIEWREAMHEPVRKMNNTRESTESSR